MKQIMVLLAVMMFFLNATAETPREDCLGAPPNGSLTGHIGYERTFIARDNTVVKFFEDNRLDNVYPYGFYGLVAYRVPGWTYQDAYDYLMGKKGSIEYTYVTNARLAAVNMSDGTLSPCSWYTGWAVSYKGILLFALEPTVQGYCYNPFWHSGSTPAPQGEEPKPQSVPMDQPSVYLPNAFQYATTGGSNSYSYKKEKGGWTFVLSPEFEFNRVGLASGGGYFPPRNNRCDDYRRNTPRGPRIIPVRNPHSPNIPLAPPQHPGFHN